MTKEELEIGAKWLSILNAYSNDFTTKSLFNQTASYLRAIQSGGAKKTSRFQKEVKQPTTEKRDLLKPMSLLEAAKIREDNLEDSLEDEPTNLLAIDETETFTQVKKGRKKNV